MIASILQPLIEQGENVRAEFKWAVENVEAVGETVSTFLKQEEENSGGWRNRKRRG